MNLCCKVCKSMNKPAEVRMRNGAMTLEAALVLPLMLCAFLTIVFIIKAVYTYELVNHALTEAASEIASASYIYHVSGFRDIHDTARNSLSEKSELFKGQVGSVFDTFNSLKSIKSDQEQGLQGTAEDSMALLRNAGQSFNKLLDSSESAASDPLEELKSIACYIASGSFNDAKTQLFTPVLKLYMKKYFITDELPDADKRLRLLNIVGGLDGFDFSESSFLADRDENIDIIVRYTIRMPLPVQFVQGWDILQRVKVKAWMGGDETTGVLDENESTDGIWSLDNFQRGQKIRRIFGGNLPSNFPVIASFSEGKAVMIKSVDMTAQSYQTGDHAEKLLKGYIKELAAFKGQEKPWGSDNITISGKEIKQRELLLVIPQNELSAANEKLLASLASKADVKGISLVIRRYGMKAVEKTTDGEETVSDGEEAVTDRD